MRMILLFCGVLCVWAGTVAAAWSTTIGVVLPGSSLVFYQTMIRGIEHAASDQHVQLLMRNPSDGASLETPNLQLHIIDYLVQQGVAGIVLAPEPLQGASTASISVPIVLVDRASTDYKSLSTVSTDNFEAGRIAAQSLLPVLRKGAKVAVLRLAPNIRSTTERENGFLSVARKEQWDVVVDSYVGYRPRDAEGLIANALNSYTGRLDAVFAPAEPIAYGALRVVEAKAIGDRPRLVVFDWRPEFMTGLKRGVIYADVVQDPYRMGYLAVEALVGALHGHPVLSTVFVDVVTVTPNNIHDPAIRAVLATYAR